MYGLIGSFKAVPGERAALVSILLGLEVQMPGCISYVVAEDAGDADTLWITEVWDSELSHQQSLKIPEVREAIQRAMPLIASFGQHTITHPLGLRGRSA
jgi:quinol monooxygenase YgiN